MTQKCTC